MRKFIVLALALAVGSIGAFADSLRSPQVAIGSCGCGEQTLQQILDNSVYGVGVVNAATQQQAAQTWYLPGPAGNLMAPQIRATYSAASNSVGIYTGNTGYNIFLGSAATGTSATITFNADGSITIAGGAGVNAGTFAGINQNNFGFYLNNGSSTFYTEDSKNGGTVRALSYVTAANDRWAIAFEDGTDFDYNDRVISVESILATPEPGSVILLGAGLMGLARKLRKKA